MRRRACCALFGAALGSCEPHEPSPVTPALPASFSAPGAPPAPAPPAAGPFRVSLRAERSGDHQHVVIVDNATENPISLRRAVDVEVLAGGAWKRSDAAQLYLRDHCTTAGGAIYEPPPCVEVAGATLLRTAPWTDSIGESQCLCEECGPAPAGTYRFVVTTCDGSSRIESAPFHAGK